MREHLFIVRLKISKTFLGKIITSVCCLHSFQGLFYYIYSPILHRTHDLEGILFFLSFSIVKTPNSKYIDGLNKVEFWNRTKAD